MSTVPEPVLGMASLSFCSSVLSDCWLETVAGPMSAPAEEARFHADLPSMFRPGWLGALECSAMDKSVREGVTPVEDVDNMMRTQK